MMFEGINTKEILRFPSSGVSFLFDDLWDRFDAVDTLSSGFSCTFSARTHSNNLQSEFSPMVANQHHTRSMSVNGICYTCENAAAAVEFRLFIAHPKRRRQRVLFVLNP